MGKDDSEQTHDFMTFRPQSQRFSQGNTVDTYVSRTTTAKPPQSTSTKVSPRCNRISINIATRRKTSTYLELIKRLGAGPRSLSFCLVYDKDVAWRIPVGAKLDILHRAFDLSTQYGDSRRIVADWYTEGDFDCPKLLVD
jgi:hypothetical protein